MKKLALCFAAMFVGCATPYAQVKKVHTIEEARALLGSYEPSITPYPPNAEAWYFGKSECVLFIDGKLRMSRDTRTEDVDDNGVKKQRPAWKQGQVICSPSEMTTR